MSTNETLRSGKADRSDGPEDDRWFVNYQLNRINGTALIGSLNPAVTSVLRSKKWASLVRGEGWVIPLRYLAHVERLLAGVDVDLFDVDGAPTPGQRERRDDRSQTARVLADIAAAREACSDTVAVEHARRAARAAFAAASAAVHANDEPAEAAS